MVSNAGKISKALGDMRYRTAVNALNVVASEGRVEIPVDDFEFLNGSELWLAKDRNRATRLLEIFAYGAVDLIGLPRFPLPAEFLAATIVAVVAPNNYQTAAVIMAGAKWSDEIDANADPVKAQTLFSMVLRIGAGEVEMVDQAQSRFKQRFGRLESGAPENG